MSTAPEPAVGDPALEGVSHEQLADVAREVLPDHLAPSIRDQLAETTAERMVPSALKVRTPTALEREQEIRQRLAAQDKHDEARLQEVAKTEREVQEAITRAEHIAQAIQVRSFQLEPNLPPPSHDPLDDEATAVVEKEKQTLKQREGEIGQKRDQDLQTLDEPLHPMVETRAKLDVVMATGDYQQRLAVAGINPRTVEAQLEARRAQQLAMAQAAQALEHAKEATGGSPLANLTIPTGPAPPAPPADS